MSNVEIDKLKETLKEYADYAIKLVKENKRLQQENKQLKEDKKKAREYIKKHQRKDEFFNLNEWQTRELL